MRRIGGLAGAALAVALSMAVPAAAGAACTAATSTPQRLDFTSGGQPTYAYVSLPAAPPRALVTYDHGYGDQPSDASDLRNIQLISDSLGAIVVAPVYRGTVILGPESTRGAPIRNGVADTVALAQMFRAACGRIPTIALGLSMGGTVAGLSAIQGGKGLYDLWTGLNPMQDSLTASLVSRAVSPQFADDLDAEAGGTPTTATASYLSFSLAARHADLARSGIRSAIIIDALGDATGAQLQTNLLQPLLILDGLPVDRQIATVADPDARPEGGVDAMLLGTGAILTGHLGLTSVRLAIERMQAFLASPAPPQLRLGIALPVLRLGVSL